MGRIYSNFLYLIVFISLIFTFGRPRQNYIPGILVGLFGFILFSISRYNHFIHGNPFLFTKKTKEETNWVVYFLGLALIMIGFFMSWNVDWEILLDAME